MAQSSHHQHFLMDKLLHGRMSRIYIFQAVMMFVKSLVGIFVPVYLFTLGFSLVEILLFNIGLSLMYLILIPHSIELINSIGFKYTLLLSVPIYFLHIISLNFITYNPYFFHLSWISFGFYISIFWPAFHSEIAVSGNNNKRSSEIGTLQVITLLVGSLAPLIGGFILEFIGFWSLLIFSSFFLFLGIIPLLASRDIKLKNYSFYYPKYIEFIKSKRYEKSKIAFGAEGIEGVLSSYIWAIVLFLLLQKNFFIFGTLFTIISIISVVFIVYFKGHFDKKNKHSLLILVSRYFSFSWALRFLATIFLGIFIYMAESIFKLVFSVYRLSFMSIFYNNAQRGKYMDYIIFRELFLQFSKIFFCSLIIVLLIVFGETWELLIALILVGIVTPFGLRSLREE